jgi:AcrR family transcriptional regulator
MKQELRSKATKDSILKAAVECFQKKGYYTADIDDICKKANLTKGAFYYHFTSKQNLILELLGQWANKVAEKIDLTEIESKDIREVISSIPEKFRPVFKEVDKQLPIFLNLYIKAVSDPDLKKIFIKSYKEILYFFTEIIKKGISNGSIKEINAEDASKILFSLAIGWLMQGLIDPEGDDWVALAKESILLVLKNS